MKNKLIVGVIGGSSCDKEISELAYRVGQEIARRGYSVVCGGMSGVMESVCFGAKNCGGTTIGILPGMTKEDANQYVDIPIVTAMSHARNAIIVRTADVVVAIDGKHGTLSEIGLAMSINKPVFGLKTWDIDGVKKVDTVDELMKQIDKLVDS